MRTLVLALFLVGCGHHSGTSVAGDPAPELNPFQRTRTVEGGYIRTPNLSPELNRGSGNDGGVATDGQDGGTDGGKKKRGDGGDDDDQGENNNCQH